MNDRDPANNRDQIGKRLGAITADLKMYVEKRVELILLNIGEQLVSWIAASIYRLTGALILLIGICFLLVALAIYTGNVVGNEALGYVIVSLPLMIIGFLFLYLKPKEFMRKMEERLESEVIKAVSKVELQERYPLSEPEKKSEYSGEGK